LAQVPKDLAWILLAFAIFNTYMLLISTQTNLVLFATLLLLEATLILLFIGNFTASTGTIKAGGYVGVATAVFAWYLSAAGVTNGIGGRIKMPVGRPLIS
jgi:succinate-acetate transporter protein